MSMTLVAIVVAVVLGQVAPNAVTAWRRHDLYARWLRWLNARLRNNKVWNGSAGIAIATIPALILVLLLQTWLHTPLLGFLGLLFGVIVLVWAWGPEDLAADVRAVVEAGDANQQRLAITRLMPTADATNQNTSILIEAVFYNALTRWFSVFFWFLLLGPVGAVLYRICALAADDEITTPLPTAHRQGAQRLLALMNWPVVQLLILSMALMGSFATVLTIWREAGDSRWGLGVELLGRVARASVKAELNADAQDAAAESVEQPPQSMPELRDAMSLVWRILLLWLVVLALFVIAGWVG